MDPRTERMLAERRAAEAADAAMPRAERIRKQARAALVAWWRTAFAAIIIVVFAILVGHYLLVTLPARERDRLLAERREAGQHQAAQDLAGGITLETCLADAEARYESDWDATCHALRRAANCSLPSAQAEPLEARRRQAREACVKQHAGR